MCNGWIVSLRLSHRSCLNERANCFWQLLLCEELIVSVTVSHSRRLHIKSNCFWQPLDRTAYDWGLRRSICARFRGTFFEQGADLRALKESLALLTEKGDTLAALGQGLSEEGAASRLQAFTKWCLEPVTGNAAERRGALWAALRRELGGRVRITEVLKRWASWVLGRNTDDTHVLQYNVSASCCSGHRSTSAQLLSRDCNICYLCLASSV